MKQLLLSALLLLFSLSIFAQGTPVSEIRVANAATAFGVNIPVGTKVYNVATQEFWVCRTATLGTATLTSASTAFTLLNPTEQTISVAANTLSLTNGAVINGVAASASTISIAATGSSAASTSGSTITIRTEEAQILDYTASATKGVVTISGGSGSSDGVDLPLATGTDAGLLKPADFTKLSNIDPTAIVGTYIVYQKEADATLVGPGVGAGIVTLNPLPKSSSTSSSVLVSYNGVELNNSAGAALYAIDIATGVITFDLAKVPISLYDLITVSYIKQ